MVECTLDWVALEDRGYDAGSGIKKHIGHHAENSLSEPFLWEDAKIEQHDRCLRQSDGAFVNDLDKPEHLRACTH